MSTPTSRPANVEPVLEVSRLDAEGYARRAYSDYLSGWDERVRALERARDVVDRPSTSRLTRELQHYWPPVDEVAAAAWIPASDRRRPRKFDLPGGGSSRQQWRYSD